MNDDRDDTSGIIGMLVKLKDLKITSANKMNDHSLTAKNSYCKYAALSTNLYILVLREVERQCPP